MRIDGACHRISIACGTEVDPKTGQICHRTDCRTTSGALFRANVQTAGETFRLVRGSPKIRVETADSVAQRAQAFCPNCGTGLYTTSPADPAVYGLRIGKIAERAMF
jgi:hypothetical protein